MAGALDQQKPVNDPLTQAGAQLSASIAKGARTAYQSEARRLGYKLRLEQQDRLERRRNLLDRLDPSIESHAKIRQGLQSGDLKLGEAEQLIAEAPDENPALRQMKKTISRTKQVADLAAKELNLSGKRKEAFQDTLLMQSMGIDPKALSGKKDQTNLEFREIHRKDGTTVTYAKTEDGNWLPPSQHPQFGANQPQGRQATDSGTTRNPALAVGGPELARQRIQQNKTSDIESLDVPESTKSLLKDKTESLTGLAHQELMSTIQAAPEDERAAVATELARSDNPLEDARRIRDKQTQGTVRQELPKHLPRMFEQAQKHLNVSGSEKAKRDANYALKLWETSGPEKKRTILRAMSYAVTQGKRVAPYLRRAVGTEKGGGGSGSFSFDIGSASGGGGPSFNMGGMGGEVSDAPEGYYKPEDKRPQVNLQEQIESIYEEPEESRGGQGQPYLRERAFNPNAVMEGGVFDSSDVEMSTKQKKQVVNFTARTDFTPTEAIALVDAARGNRGNPDQQEWAKEVLDEYGIDYSKR